MVSRENRDVCHCLPGRSLLWNLRSALPLATRLREDEAYCRLQEQLDAGVSARPYGDPEKIRPAAEALARWADELAVALERKTWDESAASESLIRVVRSGDRSLDYDSARQVAWAVNAIFRRSNRHSDEKPNRKRSSRSAGWPLS